MTRVRFVLVFALLALALPSAHAPKRSKSASKPAKSAKSAAAPTTPGLTPGAHDVVLNGVRFWYRVAGSSTSATAPVVFLHGGPGYNSHSFSVLEGSKLERSLQMFSFDQRGAGRSERPWSGHYQLDTLVDDIEALRKVLAVPRISLIGPSFGGLVALRDVA